MLRFAQNYTHNIMGYIFVTRDGVMLLEYGGDAAWVWEGMY